MNGNAPHNTSATATQSSDAFRQPRTAGMYKLARVDVPAMRAAAQELGMADFLVDLSAARNVPGFIKALAKGLSFPEWFGGNLDALYDCLTDLSWQPAHGHVILLDRYELLSQSPTSFAAFNQVLASAVDYWKARERPFWVFYLYDDSARVPGQGA